MKITRKQLRRIIKEEVGTVTVGWMDGGGDDTDEAQEVSSEEDLSEIEESRIKITRNQLRKIIKEYKEMLRPGHVDGQPWSGTLEDLATVQSKTWGHGEVVDPKGYKEIVGHARDLTAGKAKSPLKKHGK